MFLEVSKHLLCFSNTDFILISSCIILYNDINGRCSEKRVSAVAVSSDDSHVCYADKFGVVWVVELDGINEGEIVPSKKGAPLLSHYCSIITSLVR